MPFGYLVEYIPNDDKEKALQHTFDVATVSGIIYRLPPLPPTPNSFDELMFGCIDDQEYRILFQKPLRQPLD